jgi:hypothetical protein
LKSYFQQINETFIRKIAKISETNLIFKNKSS